MFRPDFSGIHAVPFAEMVRPDAAQAGNQPAGARRAYLARLHQRRFASLRAAADVLDHLPEEGESLHALMNGWYDLAQLLIVLIERLGSVVLTMRIGTLSLSRRNARELAALLDQGRVRRLDVLCSSFFKRHDADIFEELAQEMHARGQRVAAARSHAKIVTIALEDGRRYALEGSPNLRTNSNIEQFCLTRDADLFAFYDGWLIEMITRHEHHQTH